jgi:hypothetical protein
LFSIHEIFKNYFLKLKVKIPAIHYTLAFSLLKYLFNLLSSGLPFPLFGLNFMCCLHDSIMLSRCRESRTHNPPSIEFVCAAHIRQSHIVVQASSWQIKSDDHQRRFLFPELLARVGSVPVCWRWCEHVHVCNEASAVLKMEVCNCVPTRKHICHPDTIRIYPI